MIEIKELFSPFQKLFVLRKELIKNCYFINFHTSSNIIVIFSTFEIIPITQLLYPLIPKYNTYIYRYFRRGVNLELVQIFNESIPEYL